MIIGSWPVPDFADLDTIGGLDHLLLVLIQLGRLLSNFNAAQVRHTVLFELS